MCLACREFVSICDSLNTQTTLLSTRKHSPEPRQISSHELTPFGNRNNETTTMGDPTKVLIQVPTTHKSSGKQFALRTAQRD